MREQLFDPGFYQKLNRLVFQTSVKLVQGGSGSRKSQAKGSSQEFSDFREYNLGDDLRHIDWNAYGRMDRMLVKVFKEEKEGVFQIFTDSSKSMDFGVCNKADFARRMAAALSYIILNNLDRVYLTTAGDKGIYTSKGLTGQKAFSKILWQLDTANFEETTPIDHLVRGHTAMRRGTTIIISDFYLAGEMEDLLKYLRYFRQEIVLIHVLAPEELNPELEGDLQLIDSETGAGMPVSMTKAVKKAYQKTLGDYQFHIKELCHKHGAAYISASSDQDFDQVIFQEFGRAGILSGLQ